MPHISWNKLNMAMRCGAQLELYQKLGPRPPGIAAHIGTGCHRSSEMDFLEKIATGNLLELDDVKDIARDAVLNAFDDRGVRLDAEEQSRGLNILKGEAVDDSVTLAELHHTEAAPIIEPKEVEYKWELEIEGLDFSIKGFTDLITTEGNIHDLKTTSKKPSEDAADKNDQLGVYALERRVTTNRTPKYGQLDYLVRYKSKEPVYVSLQRSFSDAYFNTLLLRIQSVLQMIKKGVYVPCTRDTWICSPKWCGWFDECPYV